MNNATIEWMIVDKEFKPIRGDDLPVRFCLDADDEKKRTGTRPTWNYKNVREWEEHLAQVRSDLGIYYFCYRELEE